MEGKDQELQQQRQLTETQMEAIENEIRMTQPLTSNLLPIQVLVQQYIVPACVNGDGRNDVAVGSAGARNDATGGASDQVSNQKERDQGFALSAQFLSQKYTHLRRVRGDGNCYYRAFLYGLCESLLRSLFMKNRVRNKEFKRIKSIVSKSLDWICQRGYEAVTIEMFHEELVELLEFIEQIAKNAGHKSTTNSSNNNTSNLELEQALQQLHERLNEENATSDYCTWFLRVMTAAQMKSDPDRYLPFLLADDHAASGFGCDGMFMILFVFFVLFLLTSTIKYVFKCVFAPIIFFQACWTYPLFVQER